MAKCIELDRLRASPDYGLNHLTGPLTHIY